MNSTIIPHQLLLGSADPQRREYLARLLLATRVVVPIRHGCSALGGVARHSRPRTTVVRACTENRFGLISGDGRNCILATSSSQFFTETAQAGTIRM